MSLESASAAAKPRVAALGVDWQTRSAWLWAMLVSAVLFGMFRTRTFDDPFITYRYAEHIARGDGFVYNVGERVLSTTTPLYTLLLALLRLGGADLPTASGAIGCLSIGLGCLALWRMGRLAATPLAAGAALLLYPTFPQLIPTLGAETAFYTALVLWGIVAYMRRSYAAAAVLLALAAVTRADGVLAAAAATTHFLVARRGALPWRAIALYSAVLVPWYLFAWSYFGAPFPVTLAAKQHQGTMAISTGFARGLWLQALDYWNNAWFRPHVALVVIGIVFTVRRGRGWLLLLGWSAMYAIAYSLLGVTNYFWYYGPLTPAAVALAALGVEALGTFGARQWRGGKHLATALVLALLVVQFWQLAALRRSGDTRMAIYERAGRWLRANTAADAAVGTLEVGAIGYYGERRMIDFAGLIQPETAQQIGPTSTYADTARWAIQRYRPDYLVVQRGLFPQLDADPVLQAACPAVHEIQVEEYPFPLVFLHCTWPP